ncbi:hypothetical protein [Ralstonia mannitolilytica]|uniref:hypothetical protein n=1 Tax=Ralstonia mannitolilytica TaxID=105219 RepID=UPI000CEE20DC|nr:hypothetical protein [Ralstonia mannitolilytica]
MVNAGDRQHLLGAHKVFLRNVHAIEHAKRDVYVAGLSVETASRTLMGQAFKLAAAEEGQKQAFDALSAFGNEALGIYGVIRH